MTPKCSSHSSIHATGEGAGGTHQPFGKKVVGHLDEDVVAEASQTKERETEPRVTSVRSPTSISGYYSFSVGGG